MKKETRGKKGDATSGLDKIPLQEDNTSMNVAENDPAIRGLLIEEHRRCLEVLAALLAKVASYPKGALNSREKVSGGRRYTYHYLVFREAGRVVNRHVLKSELPALRVQIEERDRCRKEIATYRRRITYLEKLLKSRKRKKGSHGNPTK